MKINHRSAITAVLLTVAFCSACKKNNDTVSTISPEGATDMNKIGGNAAFAALRSTPQAFSVTAGTATKLLGAQGTLLKFYPNSFKDKNGNIITSGTVNISLVEMYTPGDMIANRTATVTPDGVLTSGGEIDIRATMGGQEVFANKYGIGFRAVAGASTKPMEVYYGDNNNADSITTWPIQKQTTGTFDSGTRYITDPSLGLVETPFHLFDSCTNFKLINCDHPYDGTSKMVKISVTAPDVDVSLYPQLFVSYKSINVATGLWGTQYNKTTKKMDFSGWVPIGPNCKITLMIPKGPNEYYYYEEAGTVYDGLTINATMTLLSKDQLKAKLAAL